MLGLQESGHCPGETASETPEPRWAALVGDTPGSSPAWMNWPLGLPLPRDPTPPAPRPQQRPPTSPRGQRVRSSREGGCSSSERGARPRLFKSHLGKALAKHLPVPEGFPCEVCNVQTQPANPQRRVRGISRARRMKAAVMFARQRAREEGRTAYLRLPAAGSRRAGSSPAARGPGGGPAGPAAAEASSPSGPPSSLGGGRGQPASSHGCPWCP